MGNPLPRNPASPDTETTGLLTGYRHRIAEIAMLNIDDGPTEQSLKYIFANDDEYTSGFVRTVYEKISFE